VSEVRGAPTVVAPSGDLGARRSRWAGPGATERALTLAATAAFLALLVYGAVTTESFLTVANLKAILASTAIVGIIAIGMTFILLSGNLFSLSLGTTAAIGAMLFLYALEFGVVAAILMTFLLGVVVCALQGAMVGAWGANPIIVTIGAGAIQEGAAVWISGGRSVLPPDGASFAFLVRPILGLPVGIYVLVVLLVLAELLLRRTRFGRELYLLGESKAAARAAGLPTTHIVIGVFAVAGLCAAAAGILLGAGSGRGELLLSGTFTYDAFAAAIVGGNAISGGRGSAVQAVLGALVIATIGDMLLLRDYSTGVQILVRGVIVVGVVLLVHINTRGSRT
jgi:ribose/xylose/arabinose/galactoside ABC-type transport system permease subunit